jgi:ferritin
MLNENVQKALNEQIRHELYSSYLYLAMSNYFDVIHLPGFAHWLKVQSEEEHGHALKLIEYVNDRGGRVAFFGLDQPPSEYKSPLDVFQLVMAHEQKVTGMIHALYATATAENDTATQIELQWFIKEQVEEEKNADLIVGQLKMIGDQRAILFSMDRHLGSRGK